jgi:hypothetical protein
MNITKEEAKQIAGHIEMIAIACANNAIHLAGFGSECSTDHVNEAKEAKRLLTEQLQKINS